MGSMGVESSIHISATMAFSYPGKNATIGILVYQAAKISAARTTKYASE